MRRLLKYGQSDQFQKLAIYGFGQGFNLITPILVIPYLVGTCGLENYGKTAFAMAILFFLIVFVDYGSEISGVRSVASNRADKTALTRILATTYAAKALILIVVLLVMSALIALIPMFRADSALFFLSLPILVGQFLNPTWFFQGTENFKAITAMNVASKLIYVIGIFAFVKNAGDFIYVNFWWGAGMILANGLGFLLVFKKYRSPHLKVFRTDITAHLKENFTLFSSQIFVSLQLYAPMLIIGSFATPAIVGIYRIADQIAVILRTYLLLFFNFAFPRLCFLLQQNQSAGQRFWLKYNGGNFAFVALLCLSIWVFSPRIVAYFSHEYQSQIISVLRWAIWVPLLMALSVPLKQLLLARGDQQFYINFTILAVTVSVVLQVVLLPALGLKGVITAMIAAELVTVLAFANRIKSRLSAT